MHRNAGPTRHVRSAERRRPEAIRLLTLGDVALRTGRNVELLRRWCVAGRVRCERIGRDWMVRENELGTIDGMPRRGVSKGSPVELADLAVLAEGLGTEIRRCLEEDEHVVEVIAGIEDSAVVVTDKRIFIARDGVLVTDPQSGDIAAWPLDWVRRVVLTTGASAGAFVLAPQDSSDRPIVLVLARPHLARAEAVVTSLRDRLASKGNFELD
jgi:hypothetical protein